MNGSVVRLTQGDPSKKTVYYSDPVRAALHWQAEGAKRLHIIDLDAALGLGQNNEEVQKIISAISIPTQVGGGIRSLDKAEEYFSAGADRIIIGTKALEDKSFVNSILRKFGRSHIVAAVDYGEKGVVVRGWTESTGKSVVDAVGNLVSLRVEYFLVTSANRDGTRIGPDYRILEEVCSLKVNIIAAGGIESLDDLVRLKDIGVHSVVLGRSIYDGALKLHDAIKVAGD